MPNSVTMIKRSSLILISSAAEAHFFVPEYHLTDIIYNTNMDSRKSCSTHSFLSFVFGCLQGSELTAGEEHDLWNEKWIIAHVRRTLISYGLYESGKS